MCINVLKFAIYIDDVCNVQGQWKEMFACLISKAATVDVIRQGEGPSRIDGAIQLVSIFN